LEDLRNLDNLLVHGFSDWVHNAPQNWKLDGFITQNSPVVVTSRYGQNTAIALEGNITEEAAAWDRDRDYSKIAFLTVAIATSIKYVPLNLLSHIPFRQIKSNPFSYLLLSLDASKFTVGIQSLYTLCLQNIPEPSSTVQTGTLADHSTLPWKNTPSWMNTTRRSSYTTHKAFASLVGQSCTTLLSRNAESS
jgi:hypothetical protein